MQSKIKICLLAPANSIHAQKIARSLGYDGYEVVVCTLHNAEIKDINIVYFPPVIPVLGKLINYILNISRIKKTIKNMKPDILHAHYISTYGIIGYFVKYRPFVVSVWGTDIYERIKNPIINFFVRRTLANADAVLSNSKTMACHTRKFTNKKIYFTPFGVDLSNFFPAKKKDNARFVVGTARRLAPIYGIKYLIEAFASFLKKAPCAKLLIVGDGPQKSELIELAKKLEIGDSVLFLGFVHHPNVPEIVKQMDVFCMPSEREGFGVAALEAQACGIPVIASNVGGLPEAIAQNKTGFLIEPKNPEAIAEKLLFFYSNPVARKKMGREARKFVAKHYNWDENIKIIENIYKNLL